MNRTTPSRRTVDVFADVIVAAPAGGLTVQSAGQTIGISAYSWNQFRDLATYLRCRSRSERHQLFTRLGRILRAEGLELSFQINEREIARMGRFGTGWVARVLAMPGLRIRVGRLMAARLRALARTRSIA